MVSYELRDDLYLGVVVVDVVLLLSRSRLLLRVVLRGGRVAEPRYERLSRLTGSITSGFHCFLLVDEAFGVFVVELFGDLFSLFFEHDSVSKPFSLLDADNEC